jgi:hypothetical protein
MAQSPLPQPGPKGCRVGETHQRKALVVMVIGGFHPPYEIHFWPFQNRLSNRQTVFLGLNQRESALSSFSGSSMPRE